MDGYLGSGDKIRPISPGCNLGHHRWYSFYSSFQQSHTHSKNGVTGERRGFASKARGPGIHGVPLLVVLNFHPILSPLPHPEECQPGMGSASASAVMGLWGGAPQGNLAILIVWQGVGGFISATASLSFAVNLLIGMFFLPKWFTFFPSPSHLPQSAYRARTAVYKGYEH